LGKEGRHRHKRKREKKKRRDRGDPPTFEAGNDAKCTPAEAFVGKAPGGGTWVKVLEEKKIHRGAQKGEIQFSEGPLKGIYHLPSMVKHEKKTKGTGGARGVFGGTSDKGSDF